MSAKITINRDSCWADRLRTYRVCLNDLKIGLISDDDITLFKSVGVAVEDIAAADLVYQKAVA